MSGGLAEGGRPKNLGLGKLIVFSLVPATVLLAMAEIGCGFTSRQSRIVKRRKDCLRPLSAMPTKVSIRCWDMR